MCARRSRNVGIAAARTLMPDGPPYRAVSIDPTVAREEPAQLLQELIRFDTTNPPGAERECVEFVAELLSTAGFSTELYADDPDRPNLVARLEGGEAPPLMLYGHVDVVPTEGQEWTHPPFEGVIEDGWVWGRGALDMKGGVAMMLSAALRTARTKGDPAGDVVVTILADEEAGGDHGAAFLAEEHSELFEGIEYAIGEFGGFSTEIAGQRFYPVQTNEKVVCWQTLRFSGAAGHGSMPHPGGAMADMARTVEAITSERLPVHVVGPVAEMIDRIADELDGGMGEMVRGLKDPTRADEVLDQLGDEGELLDALLHNTANPTVVQGGDKENVVPGEVELTLDCRLLPGQTDEDVRRELRGVIPDDVGVEFETVRYEPFPAETDLGLFELLAGVLEDADPDARALPFVLQAGTDARHLAKVGVQSYGFTPMRLPPDFDFMETVHAADERIPVEAVEFGADRIHETLERYDGDAIRE
jgi:acetylornithine deacetylase/succinyl-diaminopimelate desuccinylase-like protein